MKPKPENPNPYEDRHIPRDSMQESLFDEPKPDWEEHWRDMPEFVQKQLEPFHVVTVRFSDRAALEAFARLLGQSVTTRTKGIWYPKLQLGPTKFYGDDG